MPWGAASKRLVAAGWVSTIKIMLLGAFPQTMGIYDKGDQSVAQALKRTSPLCTGAGLTAAKG